jgi:hypothetical protein
MPPFIQKMWLREAPVGGRTIMYSESMCQVARSWVDVSNFHKRLFIMFMNFTAPVRNILNIPSHEQNLTDTL